MIERRQASGAWQLSPVEEAFGVALGRGTGPSLERSSASCSPRLAIEAIVRRALQSPPCVVSFSGGRDSSAILAVAADLARREGHAPPIAVTLRFPAVSSTDETEWQRSVADHVGVADWVQVDMGDELDILGDTARDLISRHGVLWPFNTHFHYPMARAARGGTLVTGFGGDEIMTAGWPWERVNRLLSRTVAPRRSDLALVLAAHAPLTLRRAAVRRAWTDPYLETSWMTGPALALAAELRREEQSRSPVRFDEVLRTAYWPSRYRTLAVDSLSRLGQDHGAGLEHPFADQQFVNAMADQHGRHAPVSRLAAMTDLVGDLLPTSILGRESKAEFRGAFFGPGARSFASTWDGTGADPAIVDVEHLRSSWRDPDVGTMSAASFTLFQAIWSRTQEPRPVL